MKARTDKQTGSSASKVWRAAFGALALIVASVGPAHGITTYSGASVSGSGTINGWGVTDAYVSGMNHKAYVSTTLRSPNNRTSSSGWRYATSTVRADVSLCWDGTDLGNYLESSNHKYYCYAAMIFILLAASSGSTPVPSVTLTLRTGNDLEVSTDNDKRGDYHGEMNTYILGYFRSGGTADHIWRTAVEVKGTVKPSSYTGTFIFYRTIVTKRVYHDTVELTEYRADNVPDGVELLLEDLNPQPSGNIYDLDAPGIGTAPADGHGYILRKRVNFKEWVTLPGGFKVSNDLLWYSHVSVKQDDNGVDQAELTYQAYGDNQAGTGNPKTTAYLQ